eukprot:scaffold110018_cov69-Phaeocystis_antarctica.AAC.3
MSELLRLHAPRARRTVCVRVRVGVLRTLSSPLYELIALAVVAVLIVLYLLYLACTLSSPLICTLSSPLRELNVTEGASGSKRSRISAPVRCKMVQGRMHTAYQTYYGAPVASVAWLHDYGYMTMAT